MWRMYESHRNIPWMEYNASNDGMSLDKGPLKVLKNGL